MLKHFFILALSFSHGYTNKPPLIRHESRDARAGFYVNIGDYVDPELCDSYTGIGKGSMYYFVEQTGLMTDQITMCMVGTIDGIHDYRAVNINSQRENDCLVKYIHQELSPDPERNYVIGLQSAITQGVWEWQFSASDDLTSLSFSHWAPGEPHDDLDENCAYFPVSEHNHLSGFWRADNCITAGYYGICEEYLINGPTTTASTTTTTVNSTANFN